MTDGELETLSDEECLQRLRRESIGRIAFIAEEGPVILPVNYRVVDAPSGTLIALRTRPGNLVEQAPTSVAFEVDSIDPGHHEGWSVLVRGDLLHATPNSDAFREQYDSEPWLAGRDAWLLVDPWAISGRELHGAEPLWHFRAGDYL